MRRRIVCFFALIIGMLFIHGAVLLTSHNFHEVVPNEFYRSAQVSPELLHHYIRGYDIKTIINLRGDNTGVRWYNIETQEAAKHDVRHINFRMSAKRELSQAETMQLVQLMRDAPKPLLVHCYGGSDRTGLASALYLAAVKYAEESEAESQLSFLFGHMPFGSALAMDRTFENIESLLGYEDSEEDAMLRLSLNFN